MIKYTLWRIFTYNKTEKVTSKMYCKYYGIKMSSNVLK